MHLMKAAIDTRYARLDLAFGRLRRLWESPILRRRFSELMREQVDPGLVRTLRAVAEQDDDCGVSEVAAFLGIDASTASRTVESAVSAGHLDRRTSDVDRRRTALRVTPAGADVLERALAIRRTLLAELTADWSDRDINDLTNLLERLAQRVAELENRT